VVTEIQNEPVPQVLIEILAGQGQSLAAAVRPLPAHRGKGSVNPCTAFRWVTKGVKTPDGRVVKLEAARVGGRWLTTPEAVARFLQSLTAAADPIATRSLPTPRSETASRRASERAAEKLKKMGA
jgi:hypothetical protein